ncbi:hypothetical protein AB0C07_28535 [Actinoplanes missouriensis]|uniref:hypothetical protein n=1 Tax=Actinoplanes missouriensis TaxID=1866 RepID=UPI0033D535D8
MAALAGLHDIDWSSLDQGSAVPRLLADLAGGEPAALRDLYRLAPDGEDVRPWVVSALPFLLDLVADPARPLRGETLRLVGDLAGADRTWQMAGRTLAAKRLLAEWGGLGDLLVDEDPSVREAAAYTLRAVYRLITNPTGDLWERFAEEPDAGVRLMLLRTSVITGAVGGGYELTKVWLASVADTDDDLRVRISALTELMALYNPVPFDAGRARETLLDAYREGLNREPEQVADMAAPLLTGARMATRQWTPGYHQVVKAVRATYRDDVDAHLGLLHEMLAMDAWDARQDALYEARSLVQRLRGPYRPLIDRAAELLFDRDAQVRAAALHLLQGVGEMARPAADAVWETMSGAKPWTHQGALSPSVGILAGLGDERVLPILERLLDDAPQTTGLHEAIAGYGVRARALGRTLRRLLRTLPAPASPPAPASGSLPASPASASLPYSPASSAPSSRPATPSASPAPRAPAGAVSPASTASPASAADAYRAALLDALIAVVPQEAADYLMQEPLDLTGLHRLIRTGRAAAARAAEIRTALTSEDPVIALTAARAIWCVTGDAEAAATVYDEYLTDPGHAVTAIDGLAELNSRAAGRAPLLNRLVKSRTSDEVRVAAARALWRITGNPSSARRLGPAWEATPRLRPRIARLWVETDMGAYATRYAKAELAIPTRYNLTNLGLSPAEISEDEQLLADCRKLITDKPRWPF